MLGYEQTNVCRSIVKDLENHVDMNRECASKPLPSQKCHSRPIAVESIGRADLNLIYNALYSTFLDFVKRSLKIITPVCLVIANSRSYMSALW